MGTEELSDSCALPLFQLGGEHCPMCSSKWLITRGHTLNNPGWRQRKLSRISTTTRKSRRKSQRRSLSDVAPIREPSRSQYSNKKDEKHLGKHCPFTVHVYYKSLFLYVMWFGVTFLSVMHSLWPISVAFTTVSDRRIDSAAQLMYQCTL